jgi:PIN domain nuclease of toxin-antitoxin system
MPAVLDTHAAIWYLLDTKNLSETVFSLKSRARAWPHSHFRTRE